MPYIFSGAYDMQITFDFAAKRIVLDGPEADLLSLIEAVRTIAPKLPQLTVNTVVPAATGHTSAAGSPATGNAGGNEDRRAPNGNATMREFARGLAPGTHSERIATIAYFMKHHEQKETFSPKEMDASYLACGFQKPSKMPIALSDAKKIRYVANSGYGQWRIDRDGENWVIGKINTPTTEENGKD